jgi:chromosome segregation ATPase
MAQQKTEVEGQLQDAKSYSRKLEGHITAGAKGQHITEINAQLKDQLGALKRELQTSQKDKEDFEAVCNEKDAQVKVLSRALDIKAEELGLRGDMRSALLYDLGQTRTELEQATESLRGWDAEKNRLNGALSEALTFIEELKLIRHANNEELNALEAEVLDVNKANEELTEKLKDVEEENGSLLDYIDEISQKLKAAEQTLMETEAELQQVKGQSRGKKEESLEGEVKYQEMVMRWEQAEERIQELEAQLAKAVQQNKQLAGSQTRLKQDVSAQFEDYREEADAENSELRAVVKELSEELVREKETQRQITEETAAQLDEAERQMQELQETASATEEVLRLKLERALSDIEELVEEREHMREAMNEAISQCAATMISQQATDREKQRRLYDSPATKPSRANPATLSAENERLRQLIASERRKSEQLLGL